MARGRRPRPQAHPRSRGENIMEQTADAHGAGSSPLTRGKPTSCASVRALFGLIPAHAGKTAHNWTLSVELWAHPRSRGENLIVTCARASAVGSSPLTRGKRDVVDCDAEPLGLIPAHAGKTVSPSSISSLLWAHPRSRGENSISCLSSAKFAGSSPLTRGKPATPESSVTSSGLIPAHAGKTNGGVEPGLVLGAHPRSRGENICAPMRWPGTKGSSPLTRGKHQSSRIRRCRVGLIPAHAGKTVV